MPRNGSGTMSIPTSFSSGTTISSAATNANNSDIAAEITNSLPRDGQAGMTGALKAAVGTAAAPGITFGSDPDTGFYRAVSGKIGIASDGVGVGYVWPLPTGVMLPYGATTAPSGWVRANGRTIGSSGSGATERANADAEELYTFLWNNYSDSVCAVSTGRGSSAAADFAAGKTITLVDMRGKGFFGLDDMGNSAAGRLGTIITNATTNGASGGTETVTLSTSQIPAHAHTQQGTFTSSSAGAHTHDYVQPAGTANYTTGGSGTVVLTTAGASTGSAGTHTHTTTISGSTANAGSGGAHSNMPPAFLGTWIIKL